MPSYDSGFKYDPQQCSILEELRRNAMTELGLIACDFLSKKGEEGTEPPSLSQKAATTQWQRLKAQGAKHSCTTVIVSTSDPKGIRKNFGFESVDTYDHLAGSLYRLDTFNNKFVGSMAVYIVVINDLPVHPVNAPLLLLSTDKKQEEFLAWLLEDYEGLTIQQRDNYLEYLAKYNLVQNRRLINMMLRKADRMPDNKPIIIEVLAERLTEEGSTEQERVDTIQLISKLVWKTDSPAEMAQRMMQVDSPLEMAQVALQVDSPAEAALNFIHSEEEMNQLIELFRQRNAERAEE